MSKEKIKKIDKDYKLTFNSLVSKINELVDEINHLKREMIFLDERTSNLVEPHFTDDPNW